MCAGCNVQVVSIVHTRTIIEVLLDEEDEDPNIVTASIMSADEEDEERLQIHRRLSSTPPIPVYNI